MGEIGSVGLLPRRIAAVALAFAVGVVCVACAGGSPAPVTESSAARPSPSSASPSVLARPFVLDGGALAVTPVAERPTLVSASRVAQVLAMQYLYVVSVQPPVLATVTWTARSGNSESLPATLKQGALAWVTVFTRRNATPGGCIVAGTSATTPGSASSAVVVDATTGDAMVYDGAYETCPGQWSKPVTSAGARYASLPWRASGTDGSYRVTLPPCAVIWGSTAASGVMTIVAAQRLTGPCSGSARVVTVPGTVAPAYAVAAPVGTLCAGHDPSVSLPLPPGCTPDRQGF